MKRAIFGALATLAMIGSTPANAAVETAEPMQPFYDSICIVTHPSWRSDPIWGNGSPWVQNLMELGVRHTRGKLGTSKDAVNQLRPFFDAGGKITVGVVNQTSTLSKEGTKKNLDFLAINVPASNIDALEHANEFNHSTSTYASQLKAFSPWLRQTVNSISALNGLPIAAPSVYIRDPVAYRNIGNLEPNVDLGNLHYYYEGRRPTITGGLTKPPTLEQAILDAKIIAPTSPMWITETGIKVDAPDGSVQAGVLTETVAGIYLNRSLFDFWAAGVKRSCIYSLYDDSARGSINHGLIAPNHAKKKHYYAIKRLVELVKDTSGSFGGQLDYTLSNQPSALKKLLFKHSDGSFMLVLWRDVDSWNRSTKRQIVVPSETMTLTLANPASIRVYHPTYDDTPSESADGATKLNIPIADDVVIVKIK